MDVYLIFIHSSFGGHLGYFHLWLFTEPSTSSWRACCSHMASSSGPALTQSPEQAELCWLLCSPRPQTPSSSALGTTGTWRTPHCYRASDDSHADDHARVADKVGSSLYPGSSLSPSTLTTTSQCWDQRETRQGRAFLLLGADLPPVLSHPLQASLQR